MVIVFARSLMTTRAANKPYRESQVNSFGLSSTVARRGKRYRGREGVRMMRDFARESRLPSDGCCIPDFRPGRLCVAF